SRLRLPGNDLSNRFSNPRGVRLLIESLEIVFRPERRDEISRPWQAADVCCDEAIVALLQRVVTPGGRSAQPSPVGTHYPSRPPRFISNEPSPSRTQTCRDGSPSATPSPTELALPMEPSIGMSNSGRLET